MNYKTYEPELEFDIAILRGPHLPKGKRFETIEDCKQEATRRLKNISRKADSNLVQSLDDCMKGYYACGIPSCSLCASHFRRWLVGVSLPFFREMGGTQYAVVILLKRFRALSEINLDKERKALRKQLERALPNALVCGGLEICWIASERRWLLHANLTVARTNHGELKKLKARLGLGRKELHIKQVEDDVSWQSYLIKFVTYHRPFEQFGPKRSRPVPMNSAQEVEYLEFLSDKSFLDFLLLRNIRNRAVIFEERCLQEKRSNRSH